MDAISVTEEQQTFLTAVEAYRQSHAPRSHLTAFVKSLLFCERHTSYSRDTTHALIGMPVWLDLAALMGVRHPSVIEMYRSTYMKHHAAIDYLAAWLDVDLPS